MCVWGRKKERMKEREEGERGEGKEQEWEKEAYESLKAIDRSWKIVEPWRC